MDNIIIEPVEDFVDEVVNESEYDLTAPYVMLGG